MAESRLLKIKLMFGKRITFILFAVILIGASFFVHEKARALTLVPPSLEYVAKPGETVDGILKLINEEAETRTLYLSTANFTAKGETGVPNFLFDEVNTDLASWITVSAQEVTLESQRTQQVPFTITVPQTAEPGGYYAGIFFGTQPPTGAGTGQIGIGSKIGTLIILRVEGDVFESATIEEFGFDVSRTTFNRLPLNFIVRVRNSGNVHVRPTGTLTVRNMLGGESVSLLINQTQGAVLPSSVRRFDALWKKQADDAERGNFFQELGREWKNFGLGNYTAAVTIEYGQQRQALTASTTLTIFPWRVLLMSAVIVVLVILLLVVLIRSYNAMIIRRAMKGKNGNPPGSA